ncbi:MULTISPECIES: hypothetical protein [Xanthomonas]|uniref:DUF7940 domain-containing protein n=1 Tax=Xanthomonas TaxID=338 RepID=UPI00161B91E9|nr:MULTISPECIES: hypothetical protein [Xanthomonas]MBB5862605.1 hypothetical protein [Xanthomonas sp. 3058]MEA9605720.1 hypothetical protein [Xanthomonas campestris pv. plantaginis]
MKAAEKAVRALGLEPVPDIANFKRWWSVKLDAAALAVGAVALSYGELPDEWRSALPPNMVAWIAGAGLAIKAAALIARGARQPKLEPCDDGQVVSRPAGAPADADP